MTRALNAQKILTSLRKGLRVTSRADKHVKHDPSYASRSTSLENVSRVDKQRSLDIAHEENTVSSSWTANHSSSLLVPQTSRWVHVVCGLWTPGTKCPNPTTMSAFDLSGALPAKSDYVSSLSLVIRHTIVPLMTNFVASDELFSCPDCLHFPLSSGMLDV